MRLFLFACLLALFSADLTASQPSQQGQRIWPRIDLIPPLGVKLSPSYARLHNRPSRRVGGWADHLAPTSREAIAWNEAKSQQAYKQKRGRLEKHYFYPKPWEGLLLGPRPHTVQADDGLR